VCSRLYQQGFCKYTFAQRRNRLTTHFSGRNPVVKRRIPVYRRKIVVVLCVDVSKRFFSSPKRPYPPRVSPILPFDGCRNSFPGLHRQDREVHHSPQCSTEAKNKWSHISTPPACIHNVDKGNFFILIL